MLFDTPVLGLADAALVAEHCDGLMLLVSLDRVDRSLPKEAVARIVSSGAPLLGVVTNAIRPEQQAVLTAMATGDMATASMGTDMDMGIGMGTPLTTVPRPMPTTPIRTKMMLKKAEHHLLPPPVLGDKSCERAATNSCVGSTTDEHLFAAAVSHRLGAGG